MNPPGSRPRSPPDSDSDPHGPQRRERRALQLGLGVSLLVHVLLVGLYGLEGGTGTVVPQARAPEALRSPETGLEVVELAEVDDPDETAEPEVPEVPPEPSAEEPALQPALPEVAASPDTVQAEGSESEAEGDDLSLAERLQPRMRDPRLWAPLEREYTDLTDEERAQLLMRGMIQDWNDSVAVAVALAEEARDWTFTDDEGRRWGLGPGGRLHLGEFSVPIPFSIGVPPGRRDEWLERQQIRDDLARGAATAAIRETWAERARAIRQRLETERGQAPPPSSPSPPPAEDGGSGGGSDPR